MKMKILLLSVMSLLALPVHANSRVEFLEKVLYLCEEYSCSVTSWIRTDKRNNRVKGVKDSLHLKGLAVDVVLDNSRRFKKFVKAAKILGLDVIRENDHIHLEMEKEDDITPTKILGTDNTPLFKTRKVNEVMYALTSWMGKKKQDVDTIERSKFTRGDKYVIQGVQNPHIRTTRTCWQYCNIPWSFYTTRDVSRAWSIA